MHTELRDKSQESLLLLCRYWYVNFGSCSGGSSGSGLRKRHICGHDSPCTQYRYRPVIPSLILVVISSRLAALAHYNRFITRDNVTNRKENHALFSTHPVSGSTWPVCSPDGYHIWWCLSICDLSSHSHFNTFKGNIQNLPFGLYSADGNRSVAGWDCTWLQPPTQINSV